MTKITNNKNKSDRNNKKTEPDTQLLNQTNRTNAKINTKEQERNIRNLQKKMNYICEMNHSLKIPSEHQPSSSLLRLKRYIDGNRAIAAIFMLFLNIGSRYINLNITSSQEYYIRKALVPELLIFAVSWMSSRDVLIAFGITTVYSLLSRLILNENSNFCIFKKHMNQIKSLIDTNNDNKISQNEIEQAIKILSSKIKTNSTNITPTNTIATSKNNNNANQNNEENDENNEENDETNRIYKKNKPAPKSSSPKLTPPQYTQNEPKHTDANDANKTLKNNLIHANYAHNFQMYSEDGNVDSFDLQANIPLFEGLEGAGLNRITTFPYGN